MVYVCDANVAHSLLNAYIVAGSVTLHYGCSVNYLLLFDISHHSVFLSPYGSLLILQWSR